MASFKNQSIVFGHLAYELMRKYLFFPYHYLKMYIIKMIWRSEVTDGSNIKMKITDLNIDCLQEMFEYLDLENLLNVADSNKRLNIAACFVFRRKYGKKRVEFTLKNDLKPLHISHEIILVSKVIDWLRFLRCFGCVTSNVKMIFNEIPRNQVDKICFYINEYCAESLINLDIEGNASNHTVFPHLQRPFVNIEMVSFKYCYLGKNVLQLNKWFPKMQHLQLYKNQMVEKKCMEMHSSNLRHLTYLPIDDNENFELHFENVIRLNPNLRSLWLHIWSAKLFKNINKCVAQLEELKIHTEYYLPDYGQVHFKNLKKFEIIVPFTWKSSDFFSKIDFSFDQLEEFHVKGIQFTSLLTFVKKYSTIKKLKMNYFYEHNMSKENALQVTKALPQLSELKLDLGHKFSVDDVFCFFDELKQLKKFHFVPDNRSKINHFRVRLSDKWKISTEMQSGMLWIILERILV